MLRKAGNERGTKVLAFLCPAKDYTRENLHRM